MSGKKIHIDYFFAAAVFSLILIGMVILASVSSVFALEKFGKAGSYFQHQLIWGILPGLFFGIVGFFIPVSFFKKWSFVLVSIAIFLMMIVFLPGVGVVAGGATRWIKFFGSTFQPSELLKLTYIIYLSAWLANKVKPKAQRTASWKLTLVPFFCILGFIFLLLYFQSNASTTGLLAFISINMYFLAGTPFWHTLVICAVALTGGVSMVVFEPYRLNRVLVAIGILKDPMGLGYQIKQSLITIGSGGIIGVGLGMSRQKFGKFLPQTMSDSIFSIYAEEVGFIGCIVLLALFILLFYRCVRIARNTSDKFSQLFVIGVAVWFCSQAFLNIGAMTQIFPLTGIPLPFISYGGSHIIAELAAVGIVLNISKHSHS